MPIYEFRCEACGDRFEALVPVGTGSEPCRKCGADAAERVLSRPAETPRLVKTGREQRRQEGHNRKLGEATKRDFKQRRARARDAANARKGGSR